MLKRIRDILEKRINRCMDVNDINLEELSNMVSKGAILVDVRSPQEYSEGHIENAICIPEYEILNRCKSELKNKNDIIILYCSTGWRSKKAQKRLNKIGYKNIYNLYNGIEGY